MKVQEARSVAAAALGTLPYYDAREADALGRHLVCELLGCRPHQLILRRTETLGPDQVAQFQSHLARLMVGEPLQYIVGSVPFLGLMLEVNCHTLIPRPETEELVAWIAASVHRPEAVVDVGTGSGCIALALKEAFPAAAVLGVDVSIEALAVAERNARRTGLLAQFERLDIFDAPPERFRQLGVLVSNPPYIPLWERHSLNPNVEAWEPPTALFVPDDDPLLFYRTLSARGRDWLRPDGWLYLEVHASYATRVAAGLKDEGYREVELRADLQGRPRMVRGQWPG